MAEAKEDEVLEDEDTQVPPTRWEWVKLDTLVSRELVSESVFLVSSLVCSLISLFVFLRTAMEERVLIFSGEGREGWGSGDPCKNYAIIMRF